jgi:predicted AAA+ superfamily ATPase
MIQRVLQQKIEKRLFNGKAVILIGARQVGKSTLFNQIASNLDAQILMLNCDEVK